MTELQSDSQPYPHSHVFLGSGHQRNERRTWGVIVLCGAMMIVEIVGGTVFGSLALVADGVHMSTHAGALLIAALAYTYARRHSDDSRFVFGTGKLTDLAGFSSAIILAMIALLVGYEAVVRFLSPVPIHFREAIPIAVLGLVVNVVSAWLLGGDEHPGHSHVLGHSHAPARSSDDRAGGRGPLVQTRRDHHHDHDHGPDHGHVHDHARGHGHDHEGVHGHDHDHDHDHHVPTHATVRDNSMRSAYIHVMADAVVSVLAITGLVLARTFGWLWMDPLAGVIGALVIANWSYGLMRDTAGVLLDVCPDTGTQEKLRQTIEVDGDRVVDLHLWRLGPGHLGAVLSVVTRETRDAAYYRTQLGKFKSLSHVTVEVTKASCP